MKRTIPTMDFEIIDEIVEIETIAKGPGIRNLAFLEKTYGPGRWRKLKGKTRVRLINGNIKVVEFPREVEESILKAPA